MNDHLNCFFCPWSSAIDNVGSVLYFSMNTILSMFLHMADLYESERAATVFSDITQELRMS